MSRRVAICQPHYIPWIGYFEMIDRVDTFVFLDDVDFIKREWKNRNRIRKQALATETKWLSVPIEHADQRETPITRARIAGTEWTRKHLDGFFQVYRDTEHFEASYTLLRTGLEGEPATLAELNVALIADICRYLGIETELRRSSELDVGGQKTEKLLALCAAAGATHYLANNGSATYLEPERFEAAGIECRYQDYEHPTYRQASGATELAFLSHLSVLDLIANHGPQALPILRSGRPVHA